MAFFRCIGKRESKEPIVKSVWCNYGNNEYNYTILEDGLYLLVVSNAYQGQRGITLPDGRVPIVNKDTDIDGQGATYIVCYLYAGDIVKMKSIAMSSWNEYGKSIFLLKNVNISSVYHADFIKDGTLTYSLPSDSNLYITVGLCCGKDHNNYYYTPHESITPNIVGGIGNNTYLVLFIASGDNTPEIELYGYDGGGAGICVFNANI